MGWGCPERRSGETLNLAGLDFVSNREMGMLNALKQRIIDLIAKPDSRWTANFQVRKSIFGKGDFGVLMRMESRGAQGVDPLMWYHPTLHEHSCERVQNYLLRPPKHVSSKVLRQFRRFRHVDALIRSGIAALCPVYAAPKGCTLLELGSIDQWHFFLLDGAVRLSAPDGTHRIIHSGTESSLAPVGALKPRRFKVIAETPVQFLWIHERIITGELY
jgi:hypothetical protein